MPRSRPGDDEELDEMPELEEMAEESDALDEFEDDLTDDLDDGLDDKIIASLDDEEEEEDDDEEEEVGVNRETEDWSESIDDMESDYWEDYTRGN